jgi:RHS repeat-associated protein
VTTQNGISNGTTNLSWQRDHVWRGSVLLAAEARTSPSSSTITTEHFHLDHLGTPRLVTNGNGGKIGYHSYYPFGGELDQNLVETPEAKTKFTGHIRDTGRAGGLSLDYMHARSFSATIGRFLSVDPKAHIKQAMRQPQMWNRYTYAINNPLAYTDPTGESVYLVTYTTGNVNSDDELRRAAYTRANAIRHQKGYDATKDTVIVRGVHTVGDFNKAVKEANGLNSKYGAVRELSLFSHSGRYDGPIFHDSHGAETNFAWSSLGSLHVNWEAGATASFYGCNTAACGFTKAFAGAQGVPTYGFGHHTYFSSDPTERVGVRTGGPLYMIDAMGNSDYPIIGGFAAALGHPNARPMVESDP